MGWRGVMRTPLLAVGLTLLGTGCTTGSSPSAQARDYVRQACVNKPAVPGATATEHDASSITTAYRNSAALAAKAAALDPSWIDLSRAYGFLADAFGEFAQILTLKPSDPQAKARFASLNASTTQASTWESLIRTDCLRAS